MPPGAVEGQSEFWGGQTTEESHDPLPPGAVAGRLIVQPTCCAECPEVTCALEDVSASCQKELSALGKLVVSVPPEETARARHALQCCGQFHSVDYDFVAKSSWTPDDPLFSSQWHHSTIRSPSAWDTTVGSSAVTVAVIDSGVDSSHPDLSGRVITGWNFVSGNSDTSDGYGHGTAVAGTIAAAANNGVGVAGVAPATRIMPLLVLNSQNVAYYSDVARAIVYAADNGARVINISLGGTSSSTVMQDAVNYAWNAGCVIFASAMNNGTTTPAYPASCEHVVAVGATTSSDTRASFSNYGEWIDVVAPGTSILTTNSGGGYGSWYGTSFSSPIAAGVAALVLAIRPSLSAASLALLIRQNADDLGAAGFDSTYGWGRVNAKKCVDAAQNTPSDTTTEPSCSISSPG